MSRFGTESRPDMTFAVDWALSNNYLSIYLGTENSFGSLGVYIDQNSNNHPMVEKRHSNESLIIKEHACHVFIGLCSSSS